MTNCKKWWCAQVTTC